MKRFSGLFLLIVALLLAVLALVISGLTLYQLLQIRQTALEAVTETRIAFSDLTEGSIEASIPFRQAFPIQVQVPVQQEFVIPIQTTLPISTVARVPVEIPLIGTYELPIPVRAQVAVDLQVIVPVSQTLDVETAVEVDTQFPLRVEMSQLGLESSLQRLEAVLVQVERRLRWPVRSPE